MISKEHWLSRNILEATSEDRTAIISGMVWQAGGTHHLPVTAMGSNILCQRHNTALSPLDATAGHAFRLLRSFEADLRATEPIEGGLFALFDGAALELWLLKVMWGAAASESLGSGGRAVVGLRQDIDHAMLAEILFRAAPWPDGWGLHAVGTPGTLYSAQAAVALEPRTGPDGAMWQLVAELGVVALSVALGRPDPPLRGLLPRPQGIVLTSRTHPGLRRLLALHWTDPGADLVWVERTGDGTTTVSPSGHRM